MKIQSTSSIDLILLGLIRNKPMSPYELSKMQGIYELVKISVPAVYKNLQRLEKSGDLVYSIVKKGNMPEKKIYSLSDTGEKRFRELLLSCSEHPIDFHFDFNVPLLFINSVNKGDGDRIIETVQKQIIEKGEYLAELAEKFKDLPFPVGEMAEQQLELCKTLEKWIHKLQQTFDNIYRSG
ncbi:MAG: PadR family transcriptional regulator [Candidatus Marinimicrobia bacterium]|nr:PadR family transcriptional regulator [Candidatus Neomarinimicrobiota bacterium]